MPATTVSGEAEGVARRGGLRVVWNRFLFRFFLFASGIVAIALDRLLRSERLTWGFAKFQSRVMCRALGVRVTLTGATSLGDGPWVFTPNHESHFDIAALLGYLPGNNRFAAKKELFREPVLGVVLRTMGMIPVDRENPADAIRRLADSGRQSSVIIFPEGTRNSGAELLPFKKGAFVAAIQLGLPVVPIVCKGTADVMPRGGYLSIFPGIVEIVVLEPIPTEGMTYEDRVRLAALVRERIERVRRSRGPGLQDTAAQDTAAQDTAAQDTAAQDTAATGGS